MYSNIGLSDLSYLEKSEIITDKRNNVLGPGEGYIFKTNFPKKEKITYERTSQEMGLDYHIAKIAINDNGYTMKDDNAFYVNGDVDFKRFHALFEKFKEIEKIL